MPKTAKRTRDPAASRDEILAAATLCFAERGYAMTTVDAVASRAGLSKGAFYWHFKSKRELLFALFDDFQARGNPILNARDTDRSAAGSLRDMAAGSTALLPGRPGEIEMSLEFLVQSRVDPELRERMRAVYREWRDAISELIDRGIREGEFREVRVAEFAAAFIGLIDGLAMAELVRPTVDLKRTVIQAVDVWLEGLRP